MKKFCIFLALFLVSASGFAAGDCSYCAEMKRLEKGFAQVKPEPMNTKTIDRQNQLVDDSIKVLAQAYKSPKPADFERTIPFFALVVRYDYQNLAAEELVPVMGSKVEDFFSTLGKMEKSGRVKKDDARNIKIAIGTAESVIERGSDPKASQGAQSKSAK